METRLLVLLGWLMLPMPAAWSQTYTVTDLGEFRPVAINADGVVAGNINDLPALWIDGVLEFLPFDGYPFAQVQDLSDVTEAIGDLFKSVPGPGPDHTVPAYWFNNTVEELPTLSPFSNTHATGISPTTGVLTGFGDQGDQLSGFQIRAWRQWPDGTLDILQTLGGEPSWGVDANDAGEVIGDAQVASGFSHATRWDVDGVPEDLGTLGGLGSNARALTADGTVVGSALTAQSQPRAFRTTLSGMVMLQPLPLPFLFCFAEAVNEALVSVGSCSFSTEFRVTTEHATRWAADASVIDLNNHVQDAAGWVFVRASGINEAGQIIGTGTFNGVTHGFLLTPAADPPEPPSVALLLNHTTLQPGQTLIVGVHVTNPGEALVVDAYVGAILPDGTTLVFVTPSAMTASSFAATASWPPYAAGVTLPEGLAAVVNPLFSYTFTGGEPAGTYQLFVVLTPPGAFDDGSIDDGDLVALDLQPVLFSAGGM
jgi:uncharacterized repeat protein (TIGR01451 family)